MWRLSNFRLGTSTLSKSAIKVVIHEDHITRSSQPNGVQDVLELLSIESMKITMLPSRYLHFAGTARFLDICLLGYLFEHLRHSALRIGLVVEEMMFGESPRTLDGK